MKMYKRWTDPKSGRVYILKKIMNENFRFQWVIDTEIK